jgi:RND superfamily putative drug exporter
VAAIGIASALLAMLVLLPAILVLCGRAAFWPFRPWPLAGPAAGSAPSGPGDLWSRVAGLVGRRPRLVWTVTALVLAALASGMVRLEAQGVPRSESFLAPVDSNAGQEVLSRHFPEAAGTPVVIIARAEALPRVLTAAAATPGVTAAEAYVDPIERFQRRQAGEPAPGPAIVDGLVRVEATLAMPGDAPAARDVVAGLRRTLHALPGAQALVGGYTAANLDIQATAQRDRLVVIPLVLGMVLLVLVLLLRAVLAALVLVGTVLLSFLAALGVSAVVFRDVIGFAGADSSFPLFAFVFLVALGVDYTIFLMSRVREEIAGPPGGPSRSHRDGTLAGLAVTGGVITSAGVVLAATFASLAVLPLVFLAQLAFVVAFGVLLDALVVRSLLVPALTVDIGPRIWWPARGSSVPS